eukprot:TRINITY_DN11980_c0_g5_i2.p1 TRINITY_DN11980_c0_g5~~TRINITY_DN11980_c0_g5_i2.p1  ORF type:complete len:307 (+),score=52.82 TRINITY_DN11980_c0_g5_i2:188-1108(+)
MAAPAPPQGGNAPAEAPVQPARPDVGLYDMLHTEVRGIMAASYVFEGARFSFSKPVGQHMQLQHQVLLGKEPSYHFSPTYVGTLRQVSPQETFPIVMADIDHKGSLMTQVIHEFSKSLRLRTQIQTEGQEFKGVQVETDYSGSDYSTSLKAVNVDFLRGTGIFIGSYLQKVTQGLSMGAECMYQYGPGGEQAIPTFAGRYRGKDFTATSTLSPMGMLEASYHHQYTDTIQFGTNMDINLAQGSCNANVGFQSNFKSSTVRGQVSAQGVVSSYYEKQLAPAVNFMLSMVVDHVKNEHTFGFGLSIGQ